MKPRLTPLRSLALALFAFAPISSLVAQSPVPPAGVPATGIPSEPAAVPAAGIQQPVVVLAPTPSPVQVDPRIEAVQMADRSISQVHHWLEQDLQAAAAWPPRGRDLAFFRSVLTLNERTRELRSAVRHAGIDGLTTHNLQRARLAATTVERLARVLHLPAQIEAQIQDTLDLVAYLQAPAGT